MLITINTDASVHGDFPVGAYAYWIFSNVGKVRSAAAFKNETRNPTEAEIMAVVNALVRLNLLGWPVKKVVVNTDCKYLIAGMNGKLSETKAARAYTKACNELVVKHSLSRGWLEIRHVKAHKNVLVNGRDHVNDWCDKACREAMRKKVQDIRFNQPDVMLKWKEDIKVRQEKNRESRLKQSQ
jgi:ribonuclease HI